MAPDSSSAQQVGHVLERFFADERDGGTTPTCTQERQREACQGQGAAAGAVLEVTNARAEDDVGLRVALVLQREVAGGAPGLAAACAGLERVSTLRMSRSKGAIGMHAASEAYVPVWKTRTQLGAAL